MRGRESEEAKIVLEPEEESVVRVITGNIVRTLLEDSNMQQEWVQILHSLTSFFIVKNTFRMKIVYNKSLY